MKVKIGDLTKIRTGKLDANASSEDGQYPFFTCSRETLKISTYSYDCECVLVAGNGDLNVKYYNGKFDAYQRTYIIEDNGSGKLFMPYLYYFMEGYIEELRKQAIGGVIKYIKLGNLTDALIELPSVDEQKTIVDILEKSKKVLDMRHEEISKLDDLIKARFVEMFITKTCQIVKLDELIIGKGEYGAQSAAIEYNPCRPRYVRITDINDDGTLNDDVVSSENVEDDGQYKLSYGDFLFARMGATVGKSYAYKEGNQIFAGYLIRYKLDLEKVIPEYLYAYTKLDEYKNWVELNKSGAAQPGINAKKYGTLKIPIAPIEEQRVFADFVHRIDKSKIAVHNQLKKIAILLIICSIMGINMNGNMGRIQYDN